MVADSTGYNPQNGFMFQEGQLGIPAGPGGNQFIPEDAGGMIPPAQLPPPFLGDQMFNQFQNPQYKHQDQISAYGSIIKDLTSGEDIMQEFEMRLCGKQRDDKGKYQDIAGLAYMDELTAREFVNYIRSIVNQNTHFSYYEEDTSTGIIKAAIIGIPYYLMMQGPKIPKKYRRDIFFQAMFLIVGSVNKAKNGKILIWSKGAISEGMQTNADSNRSKGIMDYILPWRKNKK